MSTFMVTYVGDGTSSFDRNYYESKHIPFVAKTWEPFGLERTDVYYPEDSVDGQHVVAVALCHFADRAGLDRALSAPESAPIDQDIANFTNVVPIITVVSPAT
ncbi:EthD family reductase [Mycobacterium sp. PSTR-4-N]|uniref:EthD family reductase n=1 Tax=Mycobacterium sp. PSTR-4-N TaxID=2917745 RepID=UPI001F155A3D|nr:EthD family reductase [Mycobacterium sp. PSTR-4-N]MCG7595233.1 EthD family reductase [Mycobacterium sp. PSTR-4-N]